jgi:hypothetical protein
MNVRSKRLQYTSETDETFWTNACNMPLKYLQHVQHSRSTFATSTWNKLQRTSETSEILKTYICNIREGRPRQSISALRVGAGGARAPLASSHTRACPWLGRGQPEASRHVRPTPISRGGCSEASRRRWGLRKRPGRHSIVSRLEMAMVGGPGTQWAARARERASVTGEASSQARASSVDGSGEAECGARRPDGRTPSWKHYRWIICCNNRG